MALKIRKASTALTTGWGHAKILIWGNSGRGKSWLVAGSPKPLIVLTEPNGMVSIANSNSKADVIIIQEPKQLYEFITMAKNGDFKEYDTLVFDSLTEIQKIIKDGILNGGGSETMQRQDWGKLADRMLGFIRTIRDLPFHIVCTALRSESTNEEGGIVTIGPSFEGRKTGNEVMQYFSAVAALVSEEADGKTQRTLHFHGPRRMMVKPCHPIDGKIIDPNMTEIINSIISNVKIEEKEPDHSVVQKDNGEKDEKLAVVAEQQPKKVRRKRRTRKNTEIQNNT